MRKRKTKKQTMTSDAKALFLKNRGTEVWWVLHMEGLSTSIICHGKVNMFMPDYGFYSVTRDDGAIRVKEADELYLSLEEAQNAANEVENDDE